MSIEDVENDSNASQLEANATARKKRLEKLRAQKGSAVTKATTTESNAENKSTEPLIFCSYNPISLPTLIDRDSNVDQFLVVEKKIGDLIEDTLDTNVIKDELEFETLAPKKVDWDLRRAIQPKLDILNKRTEKAISKLIRKKLNEGDSQLMPDAINSAIKIQQQMAEDDEEDNDDDDEEEL